MGSMKSLHVKVAFTHSPQRWKFSAENRLIIRGLITNFSSLNEAILPRIPLTFVLIYASRSASIEELTLYRELPQIECK